MAERGQLPFDPIEEARRHWVEREQGGAATSMVAVTSIMRVHQILMARLNVLLDPFGLTFPRYEVLMLLHFSGSGSMPVGKIGERLQVHRTSITNSLDGLERAGFVRRAPHQADRRAVLAAVTDAGREAAAGASEVLNEAHFGTEPLAAGDLADLFGALRTLRAAADDFAV